MFNKCQLVEWIDESILYSPTDIGGKEEKTQPLQSEEGNDGKVEE